MNKLFTIGYEGSDVDRLIKTLVNLKVEVLADVRELPLSRKKGLSKGALSERLGEAGIEYIHFRELGDPKPGRDAARSGNHSLFEAIFLAHLAKVPAQTALDKLLKLASQRLTCMMCFERCADHCHRSYLADEASIIGFDVFNLVADRPEKYLGNDFSIPRHHPRKSIAAAE
jgi:uncharacterized protein (DUF488 family)